jgi:hypothetical protein
LASNGHRPLRPMASMASQVANVRVRVDLMTGADYSKRRRRKAN